MSNQLKHAQVHRFGDQVALYLRGTEGKQTVHLTADQAVDIMLALARVAEDVQKIPSFAQSRVGTWEADYTEGTETC